MLRAVLLGLLAVAVTPSCSGGSDTAQVAPGAVAGSVLEVSGNVSATRNGASRALAAGADVFAEDVVDTGGGSVVILLKHNNARWAVESGQRTRVDESLAWKLAKQDGPAKIVDHASSAAGREGERTAADTRATSETGAGGGAESSADSGKNSSADSAPASDKRKRARAPEGAAKESAPPAMPSPPPPPEPKATTAGPPGGGGPNRDEEKGGGAPTAPSNAIRKETADVQQKPRAAVKQDLRQAPATAGPEAQLRGALEARRAELQRCTGGKLALTLVVRVAKGAPVIELAGGAADASIRACLERVVKQIPLAGLTASASIKLTR